MTCNGLMAKPGVYGLGYAVSGRRRHFGFRVQGFCRAWCVVRRLFLGLSSGIGPFCQHVDNELRQTM